MMAVVVRRTGAGLLGLLLVWGLAGFASTTAVAAPAVTAQEATTTAPPEETTVPDDTSAPGDTSAPEDPEGATEEPAREPTSVPALTWVVGLLVLLAAIIWMVRGSGASSGDNTTGQ